MDHQTERDRASGALSASQTLQNIQIADSRDVQVIGHADIHVGEQAQDVCGLASPYLGLRSFDYGDKDLYAGHAASIAAAARLLTAQRHERTLLFITGASGSGKSSFARAGLIPALERSYQQRNLPVRYGVCTPSRYPLENLAAALHRLGRAAHGPFSALAPHMPDWPHEPAGAQQISLLVIDQFEELFTQSEPDQREALISVLGALPRFGVLRMHLIATLRVDYVPALFAYQTLYDIAKQGIDLRAMSETELKDAIQRPLQTIDALKGKRFATDLLDRLARDTAGDAAYLPLLQVTLDDIWRRGTLTAGAYQTLTDAIQQRAEQVYAYSDYDGARQEPRSSAEQTALLQIFLDLVEVSLDDDARRDVRHRRRIADLAEGDGARRRLIDDLCAARLLSAQVEHHDGVSTEVVDIIHETLIASWPRLRAAIADQRDCLRRRARFEQALAEWRRNGRTDVYLLAGIQLAEAQALDRTRDVALRGADAQEFLKRGVAQRERQRLRQLRRAWSVAVALGILLVAALGAAWWANDQTRIVRQQLNLSESERLAFIAEGLHDEPEFALLLAYEAAARDDNSVTNQALRDTIDQSTWRPITLQGHTAGVRIAVFSADGRHILTGADDDTARLWDLNGRSLATLRGHTAGVNGAEFSPDGTRILTASYDKTARLWDLQGRPLATFNNIDDNTRVAFSPDGARMITRGPTQLWNQNGTLVATLRGDSSLPLRTAFSANGSRIRTFSVDGTIWLWDLNGNLIATLTLHGQPRPISSVIFSPDESRILTIGIDQSVRLWNLNGELVTTLMIQGKADQIRSVLFSPDGTSILTISTDQSARLWNLSGALRATLSFQRQIDRVYGAVFSPDGSRILTDVNNRTKRLWNTSGQALATFDDVTRALFSPNNAHILTVANERAIHLWSINGQPLAILQGHTDIVTSAVFSPDGSRILTASYDKTARLWDRKGQLLTIFQGHTGPVTDARFSPDGSRILTISDDGTLRLWDLHGAALATLMLQANTAASREYVNDTPITPTPLTNPLDKPAASREFINNIQIGWANGRSRAVFSPDGSYILTISEDYSVRLWDLRGTLLTTLALQGRIARAGSAVFSPDGSRLLTSTGSGNTQVWDTQGQLLATVVRKMPIVRTNGVVFSPDGSHVLTVLIDRTAQLWDAEGQLLATLQGHGGDITSAEFSPDGSRFLTVSNERAVRLWDMQGKLLATLQGHTGPVWTAKFSPDGSRVLTASMDGTARQYLINTSDLLSVAACRVGRGLTHVEIARFQIPAPLRFDFAHRRCPPVLK